MDTGSPTTKCGRTQPINWELVPTRTWNTAQQGRVAMNNGPKKKREKDMPQVLIELKFCLDEQKPLQFSSSWHYTGTARWPYLSYKITALQALEGIHLVPRFLGNPPRTVWATIMFWKEGKEPGWQKTDVCQKNALFTWTPEGHFLKWAFPSVWAREEENPIGLGRSFGTSNLINWG